MSDERKDFNFYVGNIEDGLTQVLWTARGGANGYLNEIGTYSGELEDKTLQQYIEQLAPRFPLMLIYYSDGKDVLMPATSSAFGQPRIFRHECTFGVICVDDNARGETERRRGDSAADGKRPGVIKMLSDVREDLGGLQLWKTPDAFEYGVAQYGSAEDTEKELLTFEPLKVAGVSYLARLPGLTAYLQDFETYFRWEEPDRRGATRSVEDLEFKVESTNRHDKVEQLPGVTVK